MNIARLRVRDSEVLISAVLVLKYGHAVSIFQVAMECEDVVHQRVLKFLHVSLLAFAAQKFTPRGKQIFHRNDILVAMSELNPPRVTPPPNGFCRFLSVSKAFIFSGMNT